MSDIAGKAAGSGRAQREPAEIQDGSTVHKLFASLCVGNALTTILLRYTYYYDYEISFCHFCNRTCHRLRCASSITQPGRVARRIAFTR